MLDMDAMGGGSRKRGSIPGGDPWPPEVAASGKAV